MDDIIRVSAVIAAGICTGLGVLVLAAAGAPPGADHWLRRRGREAAAVPPGLRVLKSVPHGILPVPLRGRLSDLLELAAWHETPEQFGAGLGMAAAAGAAAVGLATAIFAGPPIAGPAALLAALAVPCLALQRLRRAGRARRDRLRAELAPLLELINLELSGGAPAAVAIESVLLQSECELARLLRTQLILSRVAGSAAFDSRLAELGARLQLPPLESLAMVLALSRDYGSGVGQGLKALAADLRRVQRRELIASSRRALNRVLLPAALGVLLPFMGILLFPAVVTLWNSFQ